MLLQVDAILIVPIMATWNIWKFEKKIQMPVMQIFENEISEFALKAFEMNGI